MTRLAVALFLLATPATQLACSYGGDPPSRDVEIADGAIALDLPAHWRQAPDAIEPPTVLVAEGPGPDEHLVVSLLEGDETAEQQAIESAARYTDAYGLPCRRLDDTPAWDGPLFDCPDHTRRPWMHKVLVPVRGDGVSALLLVQAGADSFDQAWGVLEPVLDSFIWTHTRP
jgi:hypothetical protein